MSLLDSDRFRICHRAQFRIVGHVGESFLKLKNSILSACLNHESQSRHGRAGA